MAIDGGEELDPLPWGGNHDDPAHTLHDRGGARGRRLGEGARWGEGAAGVLFSCSAGSWCRNATLILLTLPLKPVALVARVHEYAPDSLGLAIRCATTASVRPDALVAVARALAPLEVLREQVLVQAEIDAVAEVQILPPPRSS